MMVGDISASMNELPNDKSPGIDGRRSGRLNDVLSVLSQAMLKHRFRFMLTMIYDGLNIKE